MKYYNPKILVAVMVFTSIVNAFSFPILGSILISAAGTVGRTMVYNGEDAYFQDSNIVWIENNLRVISNHYLFIDCFNDNK
jgi:type I restriction enzyme S subunit